MTALTTILALFILALGIGEGSELLQPLAITAIGGLLYATLLTLLVVPMIYALFNRKQTKREYKTKN
jgi:multidrug efflux pump subunit AcrB